MLSVFLCVLHSELIIENRACSPEVNDLYTEVKERENMNKKDEKMGQGNENPLYETTGGDAVCNPIYDRFVCLFGCLFLVVKRCVGSVNFIQCDFLIAVNFD